MKKEVKVKQKNHITPLLVLALFISSIGFGQVKNNDQLQIDFSQLEETIKTELKRTNIPGAVMGIVKGDQLIYAKGFGLSDVETGAPVTPEMLFRLGSTTKMFTAAALLSLADQGKFKLDEPIGKYAKGLNPKIAALTANQLLSHKSGLKDGATMFGKHDDEALGETVRALKDECFFAEPQQLYSYSNMNYWLAGYLIEALSGKAYATQLEESLFKPLGMSRTTFRPTMAMTYPLAQGHGGTPAKIIRPAADNAGNWPAGLMFSNVNDLSRWLIAFMNGGKLEGKQVLSPSVIALMTAPHATIPGSDDKYGYGLELKTWRGVRLFEHSGSRSGYGSFIRIAPEQRIAIIVIGNRTGGVIMKSLEKASELLLPLTAPSAVSQPKTIAMTEEEMRKYVGTYGEAPSIIGIYDDAAPIIQVMVRDGRLVAKVNGSFDGLRKLDETRFSSFSGTLVFIPNADGKIEFLYAGGHGLKKQKEK